MNYNPYFYNMPNYAINYAKPGLFSRLFNGINFSSILSGTQKTLNVINQTIPIVKQAGPLMKNAKTMFKVMNEFKKIDTPINKKVSKPNNVEIKKQEDNGPVFFI